MSKRSLLIRSAASATPFFLLWINRSWPPLAFDPYGPASILLSLDNVLVAGILVLIGLSTGLHLLTRFNATAPSILENHLYALTVGLGVEMVLVFTLGMLSLLYEWIIALVVSSLLFLSWAALVTWVSALPDLVARAGAKLSAASRWSKVMAVLGVLTLVTAMLGALAPPVDYDGLMYHLTAPRAFLSAHRIYPDLDNWWHNYPLAIQMLYLGCLAFHTDVAAKLLSVCLGTVFVLSIVAIARRVVRGEAAWMSAAAILGIPALAVWGSAAYADLGNAAFVGLALLAILIWLESRKDGFLILAGVEIGLALSSKYTSVIDLALLGACLAWSIRRSPARTVLRALATFGFPGVLIAAPWYIKNWVWLGSPIFPAILIPGGEPSLRYILNTGYVQQGFGTGRQIFDYLLLPLHLYSQSLRYGQYSLEMPSIVFPLLLLWFTVGRGTPKLFLALGVARFGLWAVSSQQSRFLLPCYLFLAIATAQAVKDSNLTRRPLPGFFVRSLMSGMVAVAVAAGLVRVASSQPWRPILGLESRRQFLTRALAGFPTREYIRQNLPPDALVFLIGDGRRYYCPQQCAKEVDQFGWTRIAIESDFQAQTAASLMCAQGVTHVLLSWPDINYLLLHDWDGSITDSMRFLITDFEPTMLRQVYREADASLFALDCISLTQLPQPGAYLSPGLVEASLPGGMFHQAPDMVGSRDRSSETVAQ